MKTLISLKKLNGVLPCRAKTIPVDTEGQAYAAQVQMTAMQLGYMLNQDLFTHIASRAPGETLDVWTRDLIENLRVIKGADVTYNPMYPNFPRQVAEASDMELFVNAILHYFTFGHWIPEYEKEVRPFAVELNELREIKLTGEKEFAGVFTKLVGSNESLSDEDKGYVEWFIQNYPTLMFPESIPFKENLVVVAGLALAAGKDISGMVSNATDVLRIATYLSDGDVSLAENTKFKSFPRSQRRALTQALENVIREEDIARHRNKWIKLFHNLHVGDYSKYVYEIAQKVRENQKIETFNGKVEAALLDGSTTQVVALLAKRPGEFARRLDKVLRMAKKNVALQSVIVTAFLNVAKDVNTRLLLQVLGHFKNRDAEIDTRIVFPKGSTQRAEVIDGLEPLNTGVVVTLVDGLREVLRGRFSDLDGMGSVYVDPNLANCPIPTQQRSASEGVVAVARGTHLPIRGDASTLRFFIYWKGVDIDLSATFHNEEFEQVSHVSYTRLRDGTAKAYHSGDITRAPRGACEFIDIDIDSALAAGYRYVAMNVLVFSGPTFAEHEVCYAGWMTRQHVNSNEVFDPKTVEQKIDLRSQTKNVIPVFFDLQTREAIWVDLSTGRARSGYWGNNVESNRAPIEKTVEAIVSMDNKVSLYELLSLHAQARGELVASPEDADVVFTAKDTPFDVMTINSDYVR